MICIIYTPQHARILNMLKCKTYIINEDHYNVFNLFPLILYIKYHFRLVGDSFKSNVLNLYSGTFFLYSRFKTSVRFVIDSTPLQQAFFERVNLLFYGYLYHVASMVAARGAVSKCPLGNLQM